MTLNDKTESAPPGAPSINPIAIEEELRRSYLDYAMSVIVIARLPDARDGLKPVHRRILYLDARERPRLEQALSQIRALIVGDVMGKYHPHGDQSIYDALVRMAQEFSMRVPLIDGQGNFGSVDGDPPAAMRYTEVRRAKIAHALTEDIDKETVEFQDNYDGSEKEPVVLPARFPNLLVNGASRHRRRHGDEHPAAQSGRSDRCLPRLYRRSVDHARCADRDRAGAGFPDRRAPHRQAGGARGAGPRPRLDPHARALRTSRKSARIAKPSSSPRFPIR